ncbi:MAG: thermonuclease family protein [Planctomycetes bacterium]|nr:thermonuclease family protein [Planctomycetota bacterium]
MLMRALLAGLAGLLWVGCGSPQDGPALPLLKMDATPAKHAWKSSDGTPYRLDRAAKDGAVIDGDTVLLAGLRGSVRIVGVDAEEVYKNDEERAAAEKDFDAYAKARRGADPKPVKFGTPAGMAAKRFAETYFQNVDQVLYLPDDPAVTREYYGRALGHILVDRDGNGDFEENFGVELVRQGHSPYFVKYGTSRLFHDDFVAAEKEARAAGRAIWSARPDAPRHYADYTERTEWWRRRVEALGHFATAHASDRSFYEMGRPEELERLKANVTEHADSPVTLFGTLAPREEKSPAWTFAYVSHRYRQDIPIVWDSDQPRPDLSRLMGELVYVKGRLFPSSAKAGVEIRITGEAVSLKP